MNKTALNLFLISCKMFNKSDIAPTTLPGAVAESVKHWSCVGSNPQSIQTDDL